MQFTHTAETLAVTIWRLAMPVGLDAAHPVGSAVPPIDDRHAMVAGVDISRLRIACNFDRARALKVLP